MLRQPAVAGRFYPAAPGALKEEVRLSMETGVKPVEAAGIVVPHAGYMYSGHVAGAVYSRLRPTSSVIILGPNHTGLGPPLSIMTAGRWQTPLGPVDIDEELCASLTAADPDLEADAAAHRYEHAIEVQLPFLQIAASSAIRFAPITIGTGDWDDLHTLGASIAEVVRKTAGGALIIASSDLNHYESDAVTRVKDMKAVDRILALDARGLCETVRTERVSMCGFGPVAAMLTAARLLGATAAELVKYATSAEVSGDLDRVVGYAGMIVR